jgi:hypothetical protein
MSGLQEERLQQNKVIYILQEEMKKANRVAAKERRRLMGIDGSSSEDEQTK